MRASFDKLRTVLSHCLLTTSAGISTVISRRERVSNCGWGTPGACSAVCSFCSETATLVSSGVVMTGWVSGFSLSLFCVFTELNWNFLMSLLIKGQTQVLALIAANFHSKRQFADGQTVQDARKFGMV